MEHAEANRVIGVRHQRKLTKDGEMRPTQLAIFENGELEKKVTLESSQAELDYAHGVYPETMDYAPAGTAIDEYRSHHVTRRKIASNQDPDDFQDRLTEREGGDEYYFKVPTNYLGLQQGDLVVMILGGSGDFFAHALSRQAEKIGATVRRVPPFWLKDNRMFADKDRDAENLFHLHDLHPGWFYTAQVSDRRIMKLRETLKDWLQAMDDRKKCKQRLRQRSERAAYLSPNGQYPELTIKGRFQKARANSDHLAHLKQLEAQKLSDLEDATEKLAVYRQVFEPVQGISFRIAARIIAGIQEIRRFATPAKLKAYCGVDVRRPDFERPDSGEDPPELNEGVFPRQKSGHVANWQKMARQGLYLFREQLPRQAGSKWGDKYRHFKQKFVGQEKHEDWSDKRIDTKAKWRTVTRFVRDHIYPRWMELAKQRQ
jgi:hypothetical protein